MTSLMGRLVDKANVLKAAFSELEKAVIKATRHNLKGPKEKHVRRLIVSTFDQPSKNNEIITLLSKRLEILDWIVVMKTLEVFHRLLRDGHAQFIADLKYKSSMFNLRSFKDITTPEAHYQSIFIQKYSQYLEEKVLVFKMLNLEFEKDPAVVKSFPVEEAFEKIPRLQSQLNALLNCRASKNHINNPIIVYGFTLLLKDSFKLYRALNDAIIILLEHYFNMNRANAVRALEIYKLFTKETDGVIQFFDIVRKFSRSDLPELQHAPTTLVEALENYIKDLDDGRATSNSNDRGRKLVQQFHDFKFDDSGFQDDRNAQHDDDSDSDDEKNDHFQPPPNRGSTVPPPTFDPFSFDAEASASVDALPTFGTNNNANVNNNANNNAFFNDPFGGPSQPVQQHQQYDNKKKQIENILAVNAYGAPLQPTPNNTNNNNNNNNSLVSFGGPSNQPTGQPTGFNSGPNYNAFNSSPFGGPSNNQPFGGFPSNNNNNNNGFPMGFGPAPTQNTGFGFPPANNNNPYNQPNNNNFGFGPSPSSPQNNNFGYTSPQSQPNNAFNNNNNAFGQPNNNNAFGFGPAPTNQQPQNNSNPFLTGNTTTNTNTNNSFNPFA